MSEAGTHGTAAVCLLKCWERTSENHILHAGNEPLLDIWAAAQKATLQRQVASRGPPSSMEYLNRLFPSNSPPPKQSLARVHTLTHTPQPEQRGVPDVPRVHRAVRPGSQKAGVCDGGVETDRQTHAHALPPLSRRGREEDARGQTGRRDQRPAGAGVIKGVTLARPGRGGSSGASEARGLLVLHVCAGARGGEGRRPRSGVGGRARGARSAPGELRAAGERRARLACPALPAARPSARAPGPHAPRARAPAPAPARPCAPGCPPAGAPGGRRAPPRVGAHQRARADRAQLEPPTPLGGREPGGRDLHLRPSCLHPRVPPQLAVWRGGGRGAPPGNPVTYFVPEVSLGSPGL